MANTAPGEVTQLLLDWNDGNEQALARLMPLVYEELGRIARDYLRRERRDHTLETYALVHEAYLRLVDQQHVSWRNRAQFFGLAARMMRRILIDHARSHGYAKRGGGRPKVPFDEALCLPVKRAPDLVELDDALTSLARIAPEQVKLVELRFFAGLNTEEIAQVLDVSTATVARRWRMVRAWLYDQLGEEERGDA